MARRLEVELVGDSRSLERAFARSERAAAKFQRTITRGFAAAGLTIGLGTVIDRLKSMTDAASDLVEQMSKNKVVFGQNADELRKWSATAATAMGLSQRKALAAASTFGLLFRNVGQGEDDASRLSRSLVALGGDLASLNNTDVQDALDAIRSGLTGEIEPLRRYGVFLSEARTQAQAMADTGKKTAAQLTTGEEVLARYGLLLQDTGIAQGDFARTSQGLANQQRILTAQLDNLQTALGEALLPKVTEVTTAMNLWLDDTSNRKRVVDDFTQSVNALADAFGLVAAGVGLVAGAQKKRSEAKRDLGPFGIILAGPVEAAKKFTEFTKEQERAIDVLFGWTPKVRAGAPRPSPDTMTASEIHQQARGATPATGASAMPWLNAIADIEKFTTKWLGVGARFGAAQKRFLDNQKKLAAERERMQLKRQRILAGRENQLGWLDFGLERAGTTKGNADNLRVLRKREDLLKSWIAKEGRTLQLVRELWRTRDQIRDLNKSKADKDPLAGLMQVSSKRLAQTLAAGTGLGLGGMGRLQANIAGAEIQPTHVYVQLDGRTIATAVTTHQTRGGARTARQTSGFRG